MRTLVTGALVLLVLAAVMAAIIWAGQRRMMYFPFGAPPSPAEAGLPDAEAISLPTSEGLTLQGWFVDAPESPHRFTVVVFNGNAGNRAFRAPLAAALRAQGHAVLLLDYRGFGGNPGAPTESGLREDARAARAFLLTRPDIDPSRLVYFGESLGTALATWLAREHPPAALILRSPFMSMADVGQIHYPFLPVRLLLRDRYATMDAIREVRCPLLVIAGERDSIIPLDQSRALFERASEPKQFVVIDAADHNDYALLAGAAMIRTITSFLTSVSTRGSR